MKNFWEQPWTYKESFLFALFILMLGLITELLTPQKGIQMPAFPMNMYFGLSFIVFLSFLWIFYRAHPYVTWLSSSQAAISSLALFIFLSLLLGFTRQDESGDDRIIAAIGLTHLKNSWPMAIAKLFLLTSLSLVILRRATPITGKNIGFIMNHFGLWLVIAAGSLGTGDLQRYRMFLTQGETCWYAIDDKNNRVELPFALRLEDFTIDKYMPKLALYDAETGELMKDGNRDLITTLDTINTKIFLHDWEIEIKEYLESAKRTENGFVFSDEVGSPPAAYLISRQQGNHYTIEGWVSCGSFTTEGEFLWLSPSSVLAMTVPSARRYASYVKVYSPNAEAYNLTIEVNKAPEIEGWRVYQVSYDETKGKWSELSVMEVIKDPWLPVVYTGIFLLLAGSLYIFWIGKDLKD